MFKALFGLVDDVASIVTAPVEIAADLTRVVTKPIADLSKEAAEAIKEGVKDATE